MADTPPTKSAKPAPRRTKGTAPAASTPDTKAATAKGSATKTATVKPPARKPTAPKASAAKPASARTAKTGPAKSAPAKAPAKPTPAKSTPAKSASAKSTSAKSALASVGAAIPPLGPRAAWSIGAAVLAAGAGLLAFLTRGRIDKMLASPPAEGHVPTDLLDPDRNADDRAVADFRPDITSPMTDAEREALRPATLPTPTLVASR